MNEQKKQHVDTDPRIDLLYRVCNYAHRIFALEAMKNYGKSSVPDYVIVLLKYTLSSRH